MNRRTLLRRTAALGVLGLAGCTSDTTDGDGTGNNDKPTDGTGETDTPTPAPTVTDYSIRTVETGCRTEDERASVHNGEPAVTITGMITASDPCHEAVLNAVNYSIESDTLRVDIGVEGTGEACADCVGAVEYEATVQFADGPPGTVTVSHEGERIEAGDIDSGTAAELDEPMLVDSSLSVMNVDSSSTETTANAEFDTGEKKVFVTGTIRGSNGCKTAALGSVTYDAEADALSVDVVTEDREDAGDVCTQQLVYIDYAVTVSFEGGLPSSVSVSHDGQGVMSAGYGSASASAPDDQS